MGIQQSCTIYAQGAEQAGRSASISVAAPQWDLLDQADVIVMGCPTYMGSLTSALKQFMEDSSKRWLHELGKGKWLLVLPMVVD
jgi:NAD(P)H dehydrogenase (quinone)